MSRNASWARRSKAFEDIKKLYEGTYKLVKPEVKKEAHPLFNSNITIDLTEEEKEYSDEELDDIRVELSELSLKQALHREGEMNKKKEEKNKHNDTLINEWQKEYVNLGNHQLRRIKFIVNVSNSEYQKIMDFTRSIGVNPIVESIE